MKNKKLRTKEIKALVTKFREKREMLCYFCGSKATKSARRVEEVKCSWKACKKRYNLWFGTIFYNTQLKYKKIIQILELWLQRASIDIISFVCRVGKKTIRKLLDKVTRFSFNKYITNMDKLGGDGMTIEIDESKFGKRKYNRGHRVEGVWVLGMVERSERGRVKLVVVEDRKKSTLHDIIKESIKADSVIYTDGWRGYNDLEESFQSHMTVNHSKHFKDPETQVHTNTIEGTWNGVKIGTPARGRAKTKIQRYILRYMLIKNEKKDSLDVLLNYLLYFINFLFLFLQK